MTPVAHAGRDGIEEQTVTLVITPARSEAEIEQVRTMVRAYVASGAVDLTSQDIDNEIEGLPGDYVPPLGELLLAVDDGVTVGSVALHPINDGADAEVKRLYVRPETRGRGVGKALLTAAVEVAREAGYRRVLLDTMPTMLAAIATYRSLGFREIPAYWNNVLPVVYFEKELP